MNTSIKKHSGIVILILIVLLSSCNQTKEHQAENEPTASGALPAIEFTKTEHNFGKIISGERVAYGFKFTNTGEAPLLIEGVRSGCGCTVGDYPKEPLMPGETGRIDVVFNSSGRNGNQTETVRVLTNADQRPIQLKIMAEAIRE